MGLLFRSIFREVSKSAFFAAAMFTFVLFLQRIGKLFEILVRSSASPRVVAHLFTLAIPFTLSFTLPLGVLAGVMIALSRMSGDGEIVAMRAAGVPSRRVIPPVLLFATLAMLITATASLWLTPYSAWITQKVLNTLKAAELSSEIQQQVFDEGFPNKIVGVELFVAAVRHAIQRNGVDFGIAFGGRIARLDGLQNLRPGGRNIFVVICQVLADVVSGHVLQRKLDLIVRDIGDSHRTRGHRDAGSVAAIVIGLFPLFHRRCVGDENVAPARDRAWSHFADVHNLIREPLVEDLLLYF